MINTSLFASNSSEWETPQWLFNDLDAQWDFTLDPCATPENAKCSLYYTKEDDGLTKDWSGHRVFLNPPYGRSIGKWVKKAYEESLKGAVVVCLLPSRTDTLYWHSYVMRATVIDFIKGRLKFGGSENSAPFPSTIVLFHRDTISMTPNDRYPIVRTYSR